MNEIYEFLKSCKFYDIATVDGDKPKVRPFGTIDIFEGHLYIQTGKIKEVSKQIHANPNVEITAFNGQSWIRIAAKAYEDDRFEARKHMLDAYPELRAMYEENDGNTEVFKLTEGSAIICSFTAAPKVITFE